MEFGGIFPTKIPGQNDIVYFKQNFTSDLAIVTHLKTSRASMVTIKKKMEIDIPM